jgi:hypothetical protein
LRTPTSASIIIKKNLFFLNFWFFKQTLLKFVYPVRGVQRYRRGLLG